MTHEEWEEIFNEDYGPQFVMSPALLEKMLHDVRGMYASAFRRGYIFGFVVGVLIGATLIHYL
jgi:hypothetical protein